MIKNTFVQWEPNGVMMFKEIGYVNKISECGKYAFVRGSSTGLPINELRIVDKVYVVLFDYIGNLSAEYHYFESNTIANDFLRNNLKRQDDYGLIWHVESNKVNSLDVKKAELGYLDNYHSYRRAKLDVAIRDDLNTPPGLKSYLRRKYA